MPSEKNQGVYYVTRNYNCSKQSEHICGKSFRFFPIILCLCWLVVRFRILYSPSVSCTVPPLLLLQLQCPTKITVAANGTKDTVVVLRTPKLPQPPSLSYYSHAARKMLLFTQRSSSHILSDRLSYQIMADGQSNTHTHTLATAYSSHQHYFNV